MKVLTDYRSIMLILQSFFYLVSASSLLKYTLIVHADKASVKKKKILNNSFWLMAYFLYHPVTHSMSWDRMKLASNWLMTTHNVILWLKMTIPHGNGGNAMQAPTYWLLKDSLPPAPTFPFSLPLSHTHTHTQTGWATTWHQQATWHRAPPSLCGSLNLLSKDVSVWSFPGKGKAGRAQGANNNNNNKNKLDV